MVETLLKNWKLIVVWVVIAIVIGAGKPTAAEYRRGRDERPLKFVSSEIPRLEKAKEDRVPAAYQAGKGARRKRRRHVQVRRNLLNA